MANPIITQALEVSDFSGGKTDNFIGLPGASNKFEDADNFVLTRYGNTAKLVTRYGSRLYDDDYYRIPANDRLVSLAECEDTLFQMCGRNVYHVDGGWETVTGPSGNPVFSSGSVSNYISWAKWNKHLILVNDALSQPQKVYHDGTSWVTRTLGLPEIDTSVVTITPGGAGANTYIYAFVRTDTYTIDTVTYQEVSATSLKSLSSAAAPNSSAVSITGLPVLANSTTGNYNTTTSKIEIYRTTNGGTTFYKVSEVTNGTTSYSDSMSDTTLQSQAALYTEGGVADFEQCPPAKYVVVTGDTAFYLGIQDGSSIFGNRIRQSIPGALYASPSDFYVDLTDVITGGGIINTYPIVFCRNRAYRIEGRFDEFGQGGMVAREISNTVGCISHRSIVETPEGIYFASKEGFFYTDGFAVRKISSEFNQSYAELVSTTTQSSRIYGTYDPLENRIYWACQRDEGSDDNDIIFVAHLEAPNVPFTTWSGGSETDNFAPSCVFFFEGRLLRGDRRGYLFEHVDNVFNDSKIDTGLTPDSWDISTIMYDYRSPAFDFGTTQVRKWVPRIVVNADNVTNISLTISSNNDNSGVFEELAEIVYGSNAIWGDEDALWGDPNARWNYSKVIAHWRRFPSGYLRCIYKQIRMSNSYTLIDSSDTIGTVTTDGTGNTVTLDDNTKIWSAYAVDYYVSFSEDNYTREWKVITRTNDQELVVEDTEGLLATGSARSFKLRGYKKNEVFNLLSYGLDWSPLTMTQNSARSESA